jgi:hypothetical protein
MPSPNELMSDQRFARWIRSTPSVFKKRVQAALRSHLPRYPRRSGRRPQQRITGAGRLYQQQDREVQCGHRNQVNWYQIAAALDPVFNTLKSFVQSQPQRFPSSEFRPYEAQARARGAPKTPLVQPGDQSHNTVKFASQALSNMYIYE